MRRIQPNIKHVRINLTLQMDAASHTFLPWSVCLNTQATIIHHFLNTTRQIKLIRASMNSFTLEWHFNIKNVGKTVDLVTETKSLTAQNQLKEYSHRKRNIIYLESGISVGLQTHPTSD